MRSVTTNILWMYTGGKPSRRAKQINFLQLDDRKEHAMLEHSMRPTSLTKFKDCLRVSPILRPYKTNDQRYSLRIHMRPFIVMPAAALAAMGMPGMSMAMPSDGG